MAREITEGKEGFHSFDDFKLRLLDWKFSSSNQIPQPLKKKKKKNEQIDGWIGRWMGGKMNTYIDKQKEIDSPLFKILLIFFTLFHDMSTIKSMV